MGANCGTRNRRSVGLVALIVLLSAACASPPQPVVPPNFGLAVQLISAERSLCESAVEKLVRIGPTTRVINRWDLARSSYAEAEIAFNAWLDRLKFAIDNGEDLSKEKVQEDYQRSLNEAAEKSAAFRRLVDELRLGGIPSGKSGEKLAALFPSAAEVVVDLSQAGFHIYKEIQKQRGEEKRAAQEQVKRALDSQKFKSFTVLTKGYVPA